MKFTELDKVKISHVCQPLFGEENAFHINHGGVTKMKP